MPSHDPFQGSAGHFQPFTCSTVEQAPAAPGIYAWYSLLGAGPKDWDYEVVDGSDAGIGRLRSLLEKHTARHEAQTLRMEATGAFAQRWVGEVRETSNRALQRVLSGEDVDEGSDASYGKIAPKMRATLDNPQMRKALVRILQVSTPLISAPLYIGVATELRQRLQQHADEIVKVSHLVAGNAEKRNAVLEKGRSAGRFALRAVGAGFTPESLVVWTLNLESMLEDQGLKTDKVRDVAEAAEWLLNRWYRPALGKR